MIPVSCLAINHLICLPLPPDSPLPNHLDPAQGRHLHPPTPLGSHHQNRRNSLLSGPVLSHPSNHLRCHRTSPLPTHLLNRKEDRLTSRPNNPFIIHRNNRESDHLQDHPSSRDLDPAGNPLRCPPSMGKLVAYPPSTSLRKIHASNVRPIVTPMHWDLSLVLAMPDILRSGSVSPYDASPVPPATTRQQWEL